MTPAASEVRTPIQEPAYIVHDDAQGSLPETIAGSFLPQTLAAVFDEAFDIYKRHFVVLALVVAVLFLPAQVVLHGVENTYLRPLSLQIEQQKGEPDIGAAFLLLLGYFLTGSPASAVPGFVSLTVLILASGPVAIAVQEIFEGRKPTVRRAYARSYRAFPRLINVWLLVVFTFIAVLVGTIFVVSMLLGLLIGLLGSTSKALGTGMPAELLVLLILAIYLIPYFVCCAVIAKSFVFLTPLITLENTPVSQVPSRNAQLVDKKRFLRTWAAVVFLPLVVFGLQGLLLLAVQALLESFALAPLWQFVAAIASLTLISFFFQPYWMIFVTLLYYDYRMRREGLDVRMLASGLPPVDPLQPMTGLSATVPPGPAFPTAATNVFSQGRIGESR